MSYIIYNNENWIERPNIITFGVVVGEKVMFVKDNALDLNVHGQGYEWNGCHRVYVKEIYEKYGGEALFVYDEQGFLRNFTYYEIQYFYFNV